MKNKISTSDKVLNAFKKLVSKNSSVSIIKVAKLAKVSRECARVHLIIAANSKLIGRDKKAKNYQFYL